MSIYVVYRLYDEQDNLLYVGVTHDWNARKASHTYDKHWFWRVARVSFEPCESPDAAMDREVEVIVTEKPFFNTHTRRWVPHRTPIRPRREPLEVTDENFGGLLIQSAKDALAYVRGEQTGARVRMRAAAELTLKMPPPEAYDAVRIHQLRVRLGLTQRHFADALNVSDKTVKAWEQGINQPSGPALRLLQIAERQPDVFTSQRKAAKVRTRKVARA